MPFSDASDSGRPPGVFSHDEMPVKLGALPHSSSVDSPGAAGAELPRLLGAGQRGQLLLGVGTTLDVVLEHRRVPGQDPLEAIGDVEGDQQRHGEQHHPADLPGEHGV